MKWRDTKGYKPNTSAEKVFVRYRCGMVSKDAYRVETQRWTFTGSDFDIVAYSAPGEIADDGTAWNAVSGGY